MERPRHHHPPKTKKEVTCDPQYCQKLTPMNTRVYAHELVRTPMIGNPDLLVTPYRLSCYTNPNGQLIVRTQHLQRAMAHLRVTMGPECM